jgi:hypothetical protein
MVVGDRAGHSRSADAHQCHPVPDLPAIWDGFRAVLGLGDVDAAAEFVSIEARDRYREAFDFLGAADLSSIAAGLGAMMVHTVTPAYATASIVRMRDGMSEGFVIHFMREGDGIWRIVSM